MSAEWDNFIQNLDPFLVEQERFTPPTRGERPGSAADQMMRVRHAQQVERFHHAMGQHRLVEATAEGERFDRTSGYRPRTRSALTRADHLRIACAVVAREQNALQGREQVA